MREPGARATSVPGWPAGDRHGCWLCRRGIPISVSAQGAATEPCRPAPAISDRESLALILVSVCAPGGTPRGERRVRGGCDVGFPPVNLSFDRAPARTAAGSNDVASPALRRHRHRCGCIRRRPRVRRARGGAGGGVPSGERAGASWCAPSGAPRQAARRQPPPIARHGRREVAARGHGSSQQRRIAARCDSPLVPGRAHRGAIAPGDGGAGFQPGPWRARRCPTASCRARGERQAARVGAAGR